MEYREDKNINNFGLNNFNAFRKFLYLPDLKENTITLLSPSSNIDDECRDEVSTATKEFFFKINFFSFLNKLLLIAVSE